MAKVIVGAAGIETISGALKRPKKQNGHNHGNYLVMTHRRAASSDPNCQRIYSFPADRYSRSTPVTAVEGLVRTKFTAVSQATSARLKDLSQSAVDQAAFRAQTAYKTLRQYVWHKEQEKWEQENA